MASIRVALRTWHADKDGRHLILLGIEACGRTRYISLGIKVRLSQWDKKNKRIRSTHPHAKAFNSEIQKQFLAAQNILNKMRFEDASLTVDNLKEAITGGDKRGDFWAYAHTWLDQKRRKNQIYYWKRCQFVLKKFKEFSGSPLQWSHLSISLLREFDVFMSEELGNSANTRRGVFRVLKTVIGDAVRESIVNPQDNPFHRFKFPKATTPRRVRLSLDEIARMEALDLSQSPSECVARDMYAMSFRARGARFGDIVRLTWSSIVDGRINYVAKKSNDPVSVPISKEMQTILDRYALESEDDEFVFPPMRKRRPPDLEAEVALVSSVNASVNEALKTVAEKAGISKRVTFRTARHSFASISDQMGIGHRLIQSALKHKSRQTTDIYLASLTDTSLDETFETVYGGD